jgi:hypothetical protein
MVIWKNLELLKSTRARTFELVQGLTQGQMDWQPRPGKWSAGEQLHHLVLADSLYRHQMEELIALSKAGQPTVIRRTLKDINFRPNFIPAEALPLLEIPFTVANLFIPTMVRELLIRRQIFPAQRPDVAKPVKGKAKADLTGTLERSLRATVDLIEQNRDLPFSEMKVEHPVLGTSDVPFLVRLTALHEQRHQEQLAEIVLSVPRVTMAAV